MGPNYATPVTDVPQRQTHVQASVCDFDEAIKQLHDALDVLFECLDSVLRSEPPAEEAKKNPTQISVVKVGLSNAIDIRVESVSAATAKIRDILNRLEL